MPPLLRPTCWLLCGLLAACTPKEEAPYSPTFGDTPPPEAKTLVFGVHPLHNPPQLFRVYQPLVDYINRNMPDLRLRLEASRDYAEFEKRLAARHFHFALPNPYQTVVSTRQGYRVFAKMGDDHNFHGVIVVRKDSGINSPLDLRGKALSYPAPTALAATMLPQWFLHQAGLDLRRDVRNLYVGSQESAIMNVYLRKSAAGSTWPAPWRVFAREHPDIARELEVKWETPPLLNNGLVAREDIPPQTVARLRDLFVGMAQSDEGRALLARIELSRFEAADASTYRPVADFVARFERDVRRVEEP